MNGQCTFKRATNKKNTPKFLNYLMKKYYENLFDV